MHLATWPHAVFDDDIDVLANCATLASDREGPFGVCFQHGLQMWPKAAKKVSWEVALKGKGGIPKVFPPYMRKAPRSAELGAVRNPPGLLDFDDSISVLATFR